MTEAEIRHAYQALHKNLIQLGKLIDRLGSKKEKKRRDFELKVIRPIDQRISQLIQGKKILRKGQSALARQCPRGHRGEYYEEPCSICGYFNPRPPDYGNDAHM